MASAARVSDMHICPLTDNGVPHVGGAIIGPGSATVLISGMAAATVGDLANCNGPADRIATGSSTVFINGKPAARQGDHTAHGGTIIGGTPSVQIG